MSLRVKLVLALTFAALLPMGVAAAVPWLQAERRAREATATRLDRVRRQAAILIERQKADIENRLDQTSADLAGSRGRAQPLLQGPAAAARGIVAALAERYGLDHLEARSEQGAVLATTGPERGGVLAHEEGDWPEGELRLRRRPDGSLPEEAPLMFVGRRMVPLGVETVALIGGVIVGEAFVSGVTEITGEPASLAQTGTETREPDGEREPSGGSEEAGGPGRITADVPLGDAGWVLRVSAPSGDARQVRRELRGAFAGLAPLVLGSALLVGLILAEGISRPIRGLAVRAETISAERSRGPGPSRSLDEVRRLTRSFDRMLLALSESERQRLAAERVAAWQEVARRVAHEVRNPLSPIRMAVENLRRTRDKAPAELGRALEVESATILEEVDSLKRLVEEFSQFARLPPPQCAPCDLRAVVSQAMALFSRRLSDLGVQVATSGLEQAHGVRADAEQIGRALKNVLANALDAMEGSAVKRLEIALRSLPSNPDSGQGAFEEIAVRDSGRGFDPDALRRVFEPYFTTRGERGGSGLGMAIVYRIATDHAGSVAASGAAGQGAVITLRLPVDGPPADGPPGAEI